MEPRPFHIDPAAVYDDATIVLSLGIPSTILAKARRKGDLRFCRRGRRYFHLGKWLLNWLTEEPSQSKEAGNV